MLLGYILANLLGFFFALALLTLPQSPRVTKEESRQKTSKGRLRYVLTHGCSCFYDSAILLSFSTQVASIVMLSRLDFGVSASGMGDGTAKITWAVSLLTLFPLLYVAYLPHLLPSLEELGQVPNEEQAKQRLRFGLFSLCWLLSMYPFYSKMVGYFGPSLIGNGPDRVVSDDDWNVIQGMCTANVRSISSPETVVMQLFGVAGSLFVCFCALLKIIWLGLQRQHGNSRLVQWIRAHHVSLGPRTSVAFVVVLPILAISQIWTILRLRRFQVDVSHSTGNRDSDDQWTFGQIVAITVFVPVLVEFGFRWVAWKHEIKCF
ncbi:MAG: hypothetical protein Q9207_001385 [Kuettlingeria erythrocarpa]